MQCPQRANSLTRNVTLTALPISNAGHHILVYVKQHSCHSLLDNRSHVRNVCTIQLPTHGYSQHATPVVQW